jgi:hypothetical protein
MAREDFIKNGKLLQEENLQMYTLCVVVNLMHCMKQWNTGTLPTLASTLQPNHHSSSSVPYKWIRFTQFLCINTRGMGVNKITTVMFNPLKLKII